MKLLAIFRFELAYQGRRAWPWLFFAVLLVFDFLMTRDASLAEALYEDFFLNSSFAIAKTTVFGSLIWLLVAAAVAGDAAGRDVATGMHPLLYTVPVSKAGEQTITVTVPREPVLAGIDPYHLLDWEERADDDNLEVVKARR